jgi:hypothetical protein
MQAVHPESPHFYLHEERRQGDAVAEIFARSPRAANLLHLDLGNHNLTDGGLRALAESPNLSSLVSLGLWNNQVGAFFDRSPGVEALLRHGNLPRLEALDLRNNPLPPPARQALRDRFGAGVVYGTGPVPRGEDHFDRSRLEEGGA